MEKKAGELMGDVIEVGVAMESQELVKSAFHTGIAGSLVGKLAGNLVAGKDLQETSLPGAHKGSFYMAVGQEKVGFFSVKRGIFSSKIEQMLVTYARADVAALEIDEEGMMPIVHIVLQDGTHHALMCAKIHLKKLRKAQGLLVA